MIRNVTAWYSLFLKANFHSALSHLFIEQALISDQQSLISIVKKLDEAKTTDEHKSKF